MSFSIWLTNRAEKDLKILPSVIKETIKHDIKSLADNPRKGKPLVGSLTGIWSLRTGKYRIAYRISENNIIVIAIRHRKDIYKILERS